MSVTVCPDNQIVNILHIYDTMCKNLYIMTWREELGKQIRDARRAKGMSQSELADQTSITREQISNIENGKSAPAVNIVAEIALALMTDLTVRGCKIASSQSFPQALPTLAPAQQLSFAFGIEHRFHAASVVITSREDESVLLSVSLSRREVA